MNESNNPIVSTITYNSVERIMGWYDQKTNLTVHSIHLSADKVSTPNNIFKLEHVLDMSFKPFSSGNGLFYLHTSQGVFMFEVDANPIHFIHLYKKLRR